MKRTERQHLKENALMHTLTSAQRFFAERGRQVTGALVIVILLAAAVLGLTIIRQRTQHRGEDMLAEAMVALNARVVPAAPTSQDGGLPAAAQLGATGTFATEEAKLNAALPKLKAAADAYPDSQAGITARYHMASALAAVGRSEESVKEYDEVIRRAGDDSLYGRMARLGKADAQAKGGDLDAAIATWKELAAETDLNLPEDAILMELARAYEAKGNTEEARKTFTQLVDQHPESPYTTEARAALDDLKG